ncbi:uncharacterized protein LOC110638329 [Hevea brasiliensis]|uniref:uncharacterized protein LOC110638329 n=1 Tax=Hevea brasiliensis TaxID=3981 RepID=UPI0025F55EF2|nr:uncharacterized protein LOC110638329 [Hevea brasiliensis]
MAAFFQQMAGNVQAQPPVQPQSPVRQYEKLMKYGATEFKGTTYPLEAKQWLERMERPPVLTWGDFLKEFRQKYVPDTHVDMKLQEFLSLKQGNRNIAKYEREFSYLSHYTGSLLTISRYRCKRFEAGLRPSIRLQVVGFWHENFSELISQALKLERIEVEGATEKGEKEKGVKTGG